MVLSPQELAWLQSPPAPFSVRGSFCTAGSGLLAAYALTDVLMALSGDFHAFGGPIADFLAVKTVSSMTLSQHSLLDP